MPMTDSIYFKFPNLSTTSFRNSHGFSYSLFNRSSFSVILFFAPNERVNFDDLCKLLFDDGPRFQFWLKHMLFQFCKLLVVLDTQLSLKTYKIIWFLFKWILVSDLSCFSNEYWSFDLQILGKFESGLW